MKTKNNITEKKLTKAELEAREKVIKDLKKNKSALVKRYGKDAEAVMYGRATNIAKKMAESENKNKIKELVRKSLMKEADIEVDADRYEGEQELSQVSAMMDELESLLKGFDWYYYMSDDPRVYRQWGAVDTKISDLVRKLQSMGYGEDAKTLYNQYAPDGDISMKMKEAKGKDMDKDGDIDSDDYLAARDAAIKKNLKEDWGSSDQYAMNQSIHKDLGKPTEFPGLGKVMDAAESAVDFYWDEWPEYKTDRNGLIMKAARMYSNSMFPEFMDNMRKMFGENLNEDIDLGHEDNEPHMIKGELYQIGKYSMELYSWLEELEEKGGEYDFPAWWQSKITTAKNMMSSAKHYLDFELKEPAIDAAVNALTGEEPHMDEPGIEEGIHDKDITSAPHTNVKTPPKGVGDYNPKERAASLARLANMGPKKEVKEEEISAEEKLAGKIAKALKDKANKDTSDQHNLKQARTALNKGNLDAAKKIADPYLEEGLPKGFWDKKMKAKDETNESYETLKKKIQSQGKSAKAAGAIAGAIASYKAKGGGKGPTAKQLK